MLRSWVFASCTVQVLEVHVTALYKRKSFVCLTLFLTLLYGAYYLINSTRYGTEYKSHVQKSVFMVQYILALVLQLVGKKYVTIENVTRNSSSSLFCKKNLNASKPSEHPPQVEECLKA